VSECLWCVVAFVVAAFQRSKLCGRCAIGSMFAPRSAFVWTFVILRKADFLPCLQPFVNLSIYTLLYTIYYSADSPCFCTHGSAKDPRVTFAIFVALSFDVLALLPL
jgi:hypothetical protein